MEREDLIKDLLNKNGQWLPIDQFEIKFDINETNFMQYFNLISASTKLKRELYRSKGDNWLKRPTLPFNNTNLFTTVFKQSSNIKSAKCRVFYPLFIENNLEPPIVTIRWSDEGVNNDTFYLSMTRRDVPGRLNYYLLNIRLYIVFGHIG